MIVKLYFELFWYVLYEFKWSVQEMMCILVVIFNYDWMQKDPAMGYW